MLLISPPQLQNCWMLGVAQILIRDPYQQIPRTTWVNRNVLVRLKKALERTSRIIEPTVEERSLPVPGCVYLLDTRHFELCTESPLSLEDPVPPTAHTYHTTSYAPLKQGEPQPQRNHLWEPRNRGLIRPRISSSPSAVSFFTSSKSFATWKCCEDMLLPVKTYPPYSSSDWLQKTSVVPAASWEPEQVAMGSF